MVQWVWDITQHQLHSANGVGFLALFPQLWNSSCHKPQGLCRHVIVLAPYGEYSSNSHAECVMSDQFTWLQILCSCHTQMFHFIFYVSTSPINPLILRLKSKEFCVLTHVSELGNSAPHLCGPALTTRGHIRALTPVLLTEGQAWFLWKSTDKQIQKDSDSYTNEKQLPRTGCALRKRLLQRKKVRKDIAVSLEGIW